MKKLDMEKIRFKKLLILVAVLAVSACIWDGPGRHDRGHDDRGDRHQEHDHHDNDRHDDDSRHDDDRSDRHYLL